MAKVNQTQWVLKALKRRKHLTAFDAWQGCGTLTLAEKIRELRAQGHLITTTMRTTQNGTRIAQYRLIKPCNSPQAAT